MRRAVLALLTAVLFGMALVQTVTQAQALLNPDLPNPRSAIWPASDATTLSTLPVNPLLPFTTSAPTASDVACPGDVVTSFAMLVCGTLIGGPAPAPVPASTAIALCNDGTFAYGTSLVGICDRHGDVMTVVARPPDFLAISPPFGCVSFTGGPCVTLCADGQWSSSLGSGTCSDHGGEAILTAAVATAAGGTLSYVGNGLGPTLCADGTVSHSAGSGTCSSHGGEAH